MRVHFCLWLFYFYSLVNKSHQSRKRKWRKCSQKSSKDGIGVGKARNVSASCKYDTNLNFYQQITWQSPLPTTKPVMTYMVTVLYGASQLCFHINATANKFNFTKYYGLKGTRRMFYGVVPFPVSRSGGSSIANLKKAPICPPSLELMPLPYKTAQYGSKVTFECTFRNGPVREASVKWFFTPDIERCQDKLKVFNNDDDKITISNGGRTLTIGDLQEEHEGCYLLKVSYLDGRTVTEKGYIRLNETGLMKPKPELWEFKTNLAIALGVGAGLLFTIIVLVWYKVRFKKVRFHPVPSTKEPSSIIYISYCLDETEERKTLLLFVEKLRSFNIEVILDLLSEVQINTEGGLCRWIPTNIARAEKVIVLLTQSYLNKLTSFDSNNNKLDDIAQKVHAEYNYITNILHSSLYKSNQIILISKGVKEEKYPFVFQNKEFFEFPRDLEGTVSEYSDDSFCKILKEILGKHDEI